MANNFFKILSLEDHEHIKIMNHLRTYHPEKIWWKARPTSIYVG